MTPIVKGRDCRLTVDGAELGDIDISQPKRQLNPRCPDCGCFVSRWNSEYCLNCDCSKWIRKIERYRRNVRTYRIGDIQPTRPEDIG